jgi:hypothetical protein
MPSTPSDITLAVGDEARRMTYAELADVRGISATSAPDIREVIREALTVSTPDDREHILDERDRTIAAHEETIRHLRGLLADERRRMADEGRQRINILAGTIKRPCPVTAYLTGMRWKTDLIADWNKWSSAERALALLVASVLLLALPLRLLLA